MAETKQNVVNFVIKGPEGTYDPVREAKARALRIWRDFELTPADCKSSKREAPAGRLIKFPERLALVTNPESA
jgi:hypothetical protein